MSNEEKSKQLGMDFSMADRAMKKKLWFRMLQLLGKDECYRCHEPLTEDDYTVDHITDWLHSKTPVELFFDLDNISFSHANCNSGARGTSTKPKGKIKYIGVDTDHRNINRPYRTRLRVRGKKIHIGSFATPKEAALAYDEAVERHLSEFDKKPATNKDRGLL